MRKIVMDDDSRGAADEVAKSIAVFVLSRGWPKTNSHLNALHDMVIPPVDPRTNRELDFRIA